MFDRVHHTCAHSLARGVAGLFAALTVLTRPQGAFLAPLVIVVVAWAGRGLGRRHVLRFSGAALVAPVLLIGGWSIRNVVVHGFFGLADMGPSEMFWVTARWVDLERPTFLEARGVIRPYIERYRHMSDDVDWVQYGADGPRAALEKHYRGDRKRVNADLAGLAREVIIYHPIPFIRRGLETTMKTLRSAPNYLLATTHARRQRIASGRNLTAISLWINTGHPSTRPATHHQGTSRHIQ